MTTNAAERPEWMIDLDRKAHESVCTKGIMERERNLLTKHICIALAGKTAALAQFMANMEAGK